MTIRPTQIGERLRRNGLTQALFNLPPGNWPEERGLAALPDRFADLQASLATALPYAQATGVKRVHLMAGMASRSDPQGGGGISSNRWRGRRNFSRRTASTS